MATATAQWEGEVVTARGTVGDFTIIAVWHGGNYADLRFEHGKVFDVLNLWDYETGTTRVPFTPTALAAELAAYLSDENILSDLGNHLW